jgi:hypothetical protein
LNKPKEGQSASGNDVPPNELFEWEESSEAHLKGGNDTISLTSPLRTLKTIIWSLEWEISDPILMMLHTELGVLMKYYQQDKTVIKFLQLMEAVGKYVKKRRGKSHPESVNLLRGFFIELERLIFILGISESERTASLKQQIRKFNALKKKLADARAAEKVPDKKITEKAPAGTKIIAPVAAVKSVPAVKPVPADVAETPSPKGEEQAAPDFFNPELFRQMMLDEIRLVIRHEFKKLKAELTQMLPDRPDKQG